MKNKIRFIVLACFITAVAVTGVNLSQTHSSLDVSLADISILAQAEAESGCCVAYSTDEHCGMKKDWDATGACCKPAGACDKCILSNYRECIS